MDSDFQRFIFPLARFGLKKQLQDYSVIVFEQDGLSLKMPGIEIIPYSQIEKITFSVDLKKRNGIFEPFLFFKEKSGGTFTLHFSGKSMAIVLEADSRYRLGELIRLFTFLYWKEIPFFETDLNNNPLFLLDPCTAEAKAKKIEGLQKIKKKK